MGIFEIISAIVLIIACVFIVIVVLMKETKTRMSQTISGTSADSYFGKNSGRTKDAMLNKATIAAAVIFFVLALAVNIINVYFGKSSENNTSSDTPTVSVEETIDEQTGDVSDIADVTGDTESNADATSQAEGAGATAEAAGATADASDVSGAETSASAESVSE